MGLHGSRSRRHYESAENTRKRSMTSYSAACIELADDNVCEENGGSDDSTHFPDNKNTRLTFEQVKTLEKSFEVGNKVDPERKVQLARTLGLQPRQIAVWFQNRRVRCKRKQLEKDYDALKHAYHALNTAYDALLQDHTQLNGEVQLLTRDLVSTCKGRSGSELESQQKSAELINSTLTSLTELSGKSEMFIESRALCEKDPEEGAGCSSIVSEGSSVLVEPSDYCQKSVSKGEEESLAMNEEEESCYNLFYNYEQQRPML